MSDSRPSRAWSLWFRAMYRVLRVLDPLIRGVHRTVGLGNVVELRVRGRRTGRIRSVTLGILRAGEGLYLGHPNGHTAWTRNLLGAREAELSWHGGIRTAIRARPLPDGEERHAAIMATWQHPFPGNLIYRLARGHILAAGVYFRVEPVDGADDEAPAHPGRDAGASGRADTEAASVAPGSTR